MAKDDKWELFRNFMFNELGISKGDIRAWIHEAVEEQVKQLIDQSHGAFDVEKVIDRQVKAQLEDRNYYGSSNKLREMVAQELASKIKLSLLGSDKVDT